MTAATVMVGAAVVLLVGAALLTLVRMTRGPSGLDRVIAADVMVAVVVAALAIEASVNRHSTTLPILAALSLLGFIGSLSLARVTRERQEAHEEAGDGSEELS